MIIMEKVGLTLEEPKWPIDYDKVICNVTILPRYGLEICFYMGIRD